MTFTDYLWFAALAGGAVSFVAARALLRFTLGAGHRMERHLERRLVDAALIALGLHWWKGRRRRQEKRPAPPRQDVLEGDEIYRACPLSRWRGDPGACRWCNGMLPARSGRFCQPKHARAAHANHDWEQARDAALVRDQDRCRWKGCAAGPTFEHALEVHHAAEPALGRHSQPGCWHHLDGLVTLCHRHHVEITNQQRAAGVFDTALPRWTS